MSDADAVDTEVADEEFDDDYDDLDPNQVPAATAVDVLEFLVKHLVDHPDDVHIDVDNQGRRPVLNVHVAPGDVGRVIGRRGHVAQSIRRIVRAAATRDDVEIDVEFLD